MIGQTISHYKIIEKLGEGGMGVVYKAEDTKLKRIVALKFLPPHLTKDEEANARFITEAQAASALDHQNICTIHQIDEIPNHREQMYIVMAYYEGETLREKIAKSRAHGAESGRSGISIGLEITEALDIASQIAAGLARAHEAGITHRDIKPSNIMITERGEGKILDFGIARIAGQKAITKTGSTLGTVAYMSPEQVCGEQTDHRTDIWALGVVLYEMLTSQQPFDAEHDQAVMYRIVNEEPKPITQIRSDVPVRVENIITKSLEKDQGSRYWNAAEVLESLKNVQRGDSLSAVSMRAKRGIKQRKKTIGAIAAFAILVSLIALFKFFTRTGKVSEDLNDTISPNRIAVLPFALRGSDDLAYLTDNMVDLLSIKLDGAGELRRVNHHALLSYIKREHQDRIDVEAAHSIAEHFGAGLYIVGNVYGTSEKMQLTASLYDVNKGLQQAVETQSLAEERIFDLVDELARQLLAARSALVGERIHNLAAVTTSSAAALKAYLEGEAHFRSGQYGLAVDAFQHAVQEDTTFALAYYGMLKSGKYVGFQMDPNHILEQAQRYSGHLSTRDQMLLNAEYFSINSKTRQAEGLYRHIIATYPNDIDAWSNLYLLLSHYGPRLGHSFEEARHAANRAWSIDPDSPIITAYRQAAAARSGNLQELESLTRRRLELAPEGAFALFNRGVLAFLGDDTPAQSDVLEELSRANSSRIWLLSVTILQWTGNWEGIKKAFAFLTQPSRSNYWQSRGHQALASIEMLQGRLGAVRRELENAKEKYAHFPPQQSALMMLTPMIQYPRQDLLAHREEIKSWRSDLIWMFVNFESQDDDGVWSSIARNYALGLIDAHLGDFSASASHADSLAQIAKRMTMQKTELKRMTMARDLAHSVRAKINLEQKSYDHVLDELRQIELEGWWDTIPAQLVHSQGHERYMRARALKAVGKYQEAIRWLDMLGMGYGPEFIYLPAKHYLLGEIYEEIGPPEKAVEHFSQFIDLWKNCDPELRWRVEGAEEREAKLQER